MRLSAGWLSDPAAQAVCAVLEQAGHRALFVGGCVRNSLLHRAVTDLDLTTEALPLRVTDLMQAAGFKVIPTGIDHGTVTVIHAGQPFEVTTLRRDVETDGRHAIVAFTDRIEEDAARRDFTMNALYCDPRGGVLDPLGGLADTLAGRLRFVGSAEARVTEDYLRILRFFRFHAWYADAALGFDADALDACARHAGGLGGVSAERIGAEVKKLLAAPDPAPEMAAMQATGVLRVILPGAEASALAPLIHLEAGRLDTMTRLAALGGDDPAERLRLSRAEVRRLHLIANAARDNAPPLELGYRLGTQDAGAAWRLRHALTGQAPDADGSIEIARGAGATFPVKAADLMPGLGGAALGERLKHLETRWLASGLTLTRAELLA